LRDHFEHEGGECRCPECQPQGPVPLAAALAEVFDRILARQGEQPPCRGQRFLEK
jgi:hypothetical protein